MHARERLCEFAHEGRERRRERRPARDQHVVKFASGVIRRRGIAADAYYVGRIRPRDLPPWEPEEVEPLGRHHLEDSPTAS